MKVSTTKTAITMKLESNWTLHSQPDGTYLGIAVL